MKLLKKIGLDLSRSSYFSWNKKNCLDKTQKVVNLKIKLTNWTLSILKSSYQNVLLRKGKGKLQTRRKYFQIFQNMYLKYKKNVYKSILLQALQFLQLYSITSW